ncbi:MAG: N-acetylmuramoyl-L-alanine amidase [Thermodesulfovibrionales bacterium]|nr:N-acetylmuramoyl-L-alanine amidase [Thermodesulfovibrionales bacterium]
MKKILLDAGHGGTDPGAVYGGISEEDITLDVVLRLGERLRENGHNVLYTRDRDTNLMPSDRLKMIQEYKPDAFISVHCNAATNPQAHGVETIYRDDYDYPLACEVHKALLATTEMRDRKVKHDSETPHKRLAVLGDLKTPACLVEIGFMSNDDDRKVMIEERELIVEAMLDGINNWARLK